MAANRDSSSIIAAVILGVGLVGGSYLISRSLDGAAEQLDGIRVAMADMKGAIASAAQPRPVAAPAPRRRGPDPNQRYTVNIAGAPIRGAKDAKVTIVEIGDFQ